MKQIFVFALLMSFGLAVNAQSRPSDKLFEKMALKPGVTMMSFSKEMLDAVNLNFDDDEGDEESNVTGDLHEVKLIIYTAPENEEPMAFRETTLGYLPLSRYDKVEDDDPDEDVDIRVLRKGKKVSECHVLFQGETNGVLLSFFGNFKIDEVDKLAEKMDSYK
ncbi:DUF4252 domain-containing protein [Carboxylicivirga sediminis]|uniref:DUF4252 domain-containing protein n=1 Tax=Carboxylicivirga sediminis TaxID=2006564 RepID=A0A941F3G8_9BACT|nr:DUF4252 domain-containing protein [Carboxylicivirga sediminis]MBR8535090.1 DUF4252 domain-containing protein [Carboxylicivirga sediminis]